MLGVPKNEMPPNIRPELVTLLTDREREVFSLLVDGLSNSEVGESLGISCRTVEIHRASIFDKARARNFAELLRFAYSGELGRKQVSE